TLDVLKDFGIEIKREKYGYSIKGNQRYRSKGEAAAEGDWSNAAFFLAGGALSGEVTVTGLSPSSKQGDRAIVEILEKMGADIAKTSTSITAKKSALKGINLDVRDTPDLVPVLAITAMYAEGKTVFTGVDRLKDKESDRLSAILETVARLGGHAEYQEGALTVYHGCGKGDVTLSSHNDHRLAMSAAVAAFNYQGRIILEGSESVSKSYPAFFCDYKKLGGLANEFQS
ncbi:MAG: 3-phosphoshikimate 1-carboxyvinyltransferase, partial [Clostridia bacterium]|nr:3-phosphoshikimate 1-carboxyvinyltransferase [Clostridia bacterium]